MTLASLTGITSKVGVAITVIVVVRARRGRQGTGDVQPYIGVGVSDPVCDW
jgi:hypothetical protein